MKLVSVDGYVAHKLTWPPKDAHARQRKAFHKWMARDWAGIKLNRWHNHEYAGHAAQVAWEAWLHCTRRQK